MQNKKGVKTNRIVWDVDTQNDLVADGGSFLIPGVEDYIEGFGEALDHFEKLDIPILGSVDAHVGVESYPGTRDENLPLHCVKGTYGQEKVHSTKSENIMYVSDYPYDDLALDLVCKNVRNGSRVYLEKQKQSCASNPNTIPLLKMLGVEEAFFIGVLINVCIKKADELFKSIGINTYLVEGAVMGVDFPNDSVDDTIAQMVSTGSKLYKYK